MLLLSLNLNSQHKQLKISTLTRYTSFPDGKLCVEKIDMSIRILPCGNHNWFLEKGIGRPSEFNR